MDWPRVPSLVLDPSRIPPEVEVKGLSVNNQGRLSLNGPGRLDDVTLAEMRSKLRIQEVVFDLARGLTRFYHAQPKCEAPPHVLFPQLARLVQQYLDKKVLVHSPADLKDVYFSPYYGWLVEILTENIRPDASQGEVPEIPLYESHRGPGSTAEVDFWTSRDVREITHSHLNYIVADTQRWEQMAAYYLDKHPAVAAFVKNSGLGFGIPYLHNGQMHEYFPDYLVRLKTTPPLNVILETKGYDPLEDVKRAAAERWVAAVNAEGSYGKWRYVLVNKIPDIAGLIANLAAQVSG